MMKGKGWVSGEKGVKVKLPIEWWNDLQVVWFISLFQLILD